MFNFTGTNLNALLFIILLYLFLISCAEALLFGIFFSFLLLFGFWKMMVMLFVASDNCAFELSILMSTF